MATVRGGAKLDAALRELARGAASVVITIPDASRPCPSDVVLTHLLRELDLGGVDDDAVAVVVGCVIV